MFTITPCILALVLAGLQQVLPTSAEKQLMVCEKIDEESLNPGQIGTISGPPGPPGRRGPPGPPGLPGSPSVASLEETGAIDRKLDSIYAQINCPGVLYNNVCYWLPFSSLKMGMFDTKAKALNYCAMFNGTLVDIESEQMYDALYLYLQMTWNYYIDDTNNNGVDFWLASIYQGGRFRSANGGPIYVRVRTQYTPHTSTSVALTVRARASRPDSQCGYYTPPMRNSYGVPFCRL